MNLVDPYLKTARAKEHLEALRKELDIFGESKVQLIAHDDVKNQRCWVDPKIGDIPDKVYVVVGDIFYNLRACLDQLVWCLAKLSISYPEHTQFPILEQRDDKLFDRQTKGIPADARTIIESLQPYNGRDVAAVRSHLLWQLNKMCIIDKHMRIPAYSTVLDFNLPADILAHTRFEDGGVMNVPLSLKPALKTHMSLNPPKSLQIVFGDSYFGIECDFDRIETMYNFVADNVIPRFSRFFK